jgi:hypothetical protein
VERTLCSTASRAQEFHGVLLPSIAEFTRARGKFHATLHWGAHLRLEDPPFLQPSYTEAAPKKNAQDTDNFLAGRAVRLNT